MGRHKKGFVRGSNHLSQSAVIALRQRQFALRVKDQELADAAGICRSYVSLMMNHRVPFQKKFVAAIEARLSKEEV